MSAELTAIILVGVILSTLMIASMVFLFFVLRGIVNKIDKRTSGFNTEPSERSGKMRGAV